MTAINKQVDTISNNLANVSTNGFKRDIAVNESFPEMLANRVNGTANQKTSVPIGQMSLGYDIVEVHTDYSQGSLQKTDNALDLALNGADLAFFSVLVPDENGDNRVMYTRDGAFTVDSMGRLSTKDGYLVVGQDGPVQLENYKEGSLAIKEDGTVLSGDRVVDRLAIVQFAGGTVLRKYGNNLVTAENAEVVPFSGEVRQGYLESSNVNSIKEMVELITAMRAYEANQKVLQTQDETLGKAVNQIGTVG